MLRKGEILYKEISEQIWEAALTVRRNFGSGHKETLYQEAFADELTSRGVSFQRETPIIIRHPITGKALKHNYRPDFLIAGQIIVEAKALSYTPKGAIQQLYDYLKNSQYELGYFVNFSEPTIHPHRVLLTNDRKNLAVTRAVAVNCSVGKSLAVLAVSIAVISSVLAVPSSVEAAITERIPINGQVLKNPGLEVVDDGDYSFTFKIYSAETGGTKHWEETQTIAVKRGIFQADLGKGSAFGTQVNWNNADLWLEITFSGEVMSPRKRVLPAATAISAKTLAGNTININNGSIEVQASVIPSTSGLNLGSSTNKFATGYFDNLAVDTSNTSGTTSAAFAVNTDAGADNETATLRFYRGPTVNSYAALQWDASNTRFNLFSNEGSTTLGTLRLGDLNSTGSLTVGDASGDTTTVNAAAWTFANDTTVALSGGVDGINFDSNTLSIDATNDRVGILDASPAAALTVGSGDLFQVNSSGAVAAVVGITSSSNYSQSAGTFSLTSANTTQTTTSSASAINVNSLTSGTGLYVASSTLTTGKLVDLQVSGTAAGASQTALNIATAGANATSGITSYGAQIANTHTGTTSTNVGLYATASGGTNNYAAVFDAGSVGIGDTTPDFTLDVAGTLGVDGNITLGDTSGDTVTSTAAAWTFSSDTAVTLSGGVDGINFDANTLSIDATNDRVGIGTAAPSSIFHINTTAGNYFMRHSTSTQAFGIGIDNNSDWSFDDITGAVKKIVVKDGATADIGLLPSGGNVGIGTSSPAAGMELDVAGQIQLNLAGTQTAVALCGSHTAGSGASVSDVEIVDCTGTPAADYAEMYPVAGPWEYGDVVSLSGETVVTKDGLRSPRLTRSSAPHQTTAFGVLSDNHGDFSSVGYNIKAEDNPVPVALNGRVPVKISAENGPIQTGDYLTSSSTPGQAMKATTYGRVIGMALENGSDGTIMMVVQNFYYNPVTGTNLQGTNNQFETLVVTGLTKVSSLEVTTDAKILGQLTVENDLTVKGVAKVAGISTATTAKSDDYTANNLDSTITADATTKAITVTLPSAKDISGRQYLVKKIDSSTNAVTIATIDNQTIDGSPKLMLPAQWNYVTLQSDGNNWLVIGGNQ